MNEAEKMAEDRAKYIDAHFDMGLGAFTLQTLTEIISEYTRKVAERTREEDQSKMEQELAGIVATHPWMGLPNFHTGAKWEDKESPINKEKA